MSVLLPLFAGPVADSTPRRAPLFWGSGATAVALRDCTGGGPPIVVLGCRDQAIAGGGSCGREAGERRGRGRGVGGNRGGRGFPPAGRASGPPPEERSDDGGWDRSPEAPPDTGGLGGSMITTTAALVAARRITRVTLHPRSVRSTRGCNVTGVYRPRDMQVVRRRAALEA